MSRAFSQPHQDRLDRWGKELDDQGRIALDHVVEHEGKHWFVKQKTGHHEERKRDFLAHALGESLVNVAEVRFLSRDDVDSLLGLGVLAKDATPDNSWLVRWAQDYARDELSVADPEKAVAGELVFSTLVRRRDAHALNRAYVDGVPVFFDHHVAFLGEPDLEELNTFFNEQQTSEGHACAWRVRAIDRRQKMDTQTARRNARDHHYVYSFEAFRAEVKEAVGMVNADRRDWGDLVRRSGYEDGRAMEVLRFLNENRAGLSDASARLLQVVFKG